MTKSRRPLVLAVLFLWLGNVAVHAKPAHHTRPPKPGSHAHGSVRTPKAKTNTPKIQKSVGGVRTAAAGKKVHAVKTTRGAMTGSRHATATKPAKTVRASKALSKTSTHANTTPQLTSGGIPVSYTASNPIANKIAAKPNLLAKVHRLLPTGMTLQQASMGFKNQGQFLAALNVSNNLGLNFTALQQAMTGPNAVSLGQAIQQQRKLSSANAQAAAANAQSWAVTQIQVQGSGPGPTSTTGTMQPGGTTGGKSKGRKQTKN